MRPRLWRRRSRQQLPAGLPGRVLGFETLEPRRALAVTPGIHLSAGTDHTTYTLALATTAELTAAAGGKIATKALLKQLVGELNAIFESELALSFQLHPQNDQLIFENPLTDGYTNGLVAAMIAENPLVINTTLNGSPTNDSGYDFGHVLGLGNDGGFAGTGAKARGATNLLTAAASRSSIKSVAHELGHQMSASHTFNGVGFQCAAHRNAATAVEPGSGSSIMAYQEICGSDNLPLVPGDGTYLHATSFDEIVRYLTTTLGNLGTKVPTGNTLPTVNAGIDRTIPAATPFVLTATASDPDAGDQLLFSWDQIDAGTPTGIAVPVPNGQDHAGPLFRSFAPSANPARSFPRLEDLASALPANQNPNEHLPTQDRTLNFRVTVRDQHRFQGRRISGIRSDDVKLTVVSTGSPFRVTAWNSGQPSIPGGSQQTITWDVAGTTAHGINTSHVDIFLSADGGLSYPLKLASRTANDGSAVVTIPNLTLDQARIKVQAVADQNIFFDINDADFRVVQDENLSGGIVLTPSQGTTAVAEGIFAQAGLAHIDTYTLGLTRPPTGDVTITVSADSQLLVSRNGSQFAASQTVTLRAGETTAATIYVQAIDDALREGVHFGRVRHAVTSSADPAYSSQVLIADMVPSVVTQISDDEAPPLIGVELDFGDPPSVPQNWTSVDSPFGVQVTNAVRENGDRTGVDLSIAIANPHQGAGWSFRTLDESTIPQHHPDLGPIDDVMYWVNTPVTATWSGLKPKSRYRVYVFAASEANVSTEAPIQQTIRIRGDGSDNPAAFVQDGTGKTTGDGTFKHLQLFVNGAVGDASLPLEHFGLPVTSTHDGKIVVQVEPLAGGHSVLSALAIHEVLEPGAIPDVLVSESAGSTFTSETGGQDTATVVLTAAPTTSVVLAVASQRESEATVAPQTLTFTPQNWNVPQTVTVKGVADSVSDGDQPFQILVSVVVPQSDSSYALVPAKRILGVNRETDVVLPPWQNANNRFDVSGDGSVVPLDALRIFNELNDPQHRDAQGRLPATRPAGTSYYDVNGDGFVTTNDALQVVNFLNGSGEGEGRRQDDARWLAAAWTAALWRAWATFQPGDPDDLLEEDHLARDLPT